MVRRPARSANRCAAQSVPLPISSGARSRQASEEGTKPTPRRNGSISKSKDCRRRTIYSALQSRAAQLSNDIAQTRLLLFVESDSLVPAPLSGNPGVLARYHICKLQPVFAAERDGVHLPFAVCLISRMRDLPDFGTKPTIHWPVDDFERAAAKRPRLALTADIVALLDASRARRALWPQAYGISAQRFGYYAVRIGAAAE